MACRFFCYPSRAHTERHTDPGWEPTELTNRRAFSKFWVATARFAMAQCGGAIPHARRRRNPGETARNRATPVGSAEDPKGLALPNSAVDLDDLVCRRSSPFVVRRWASPDTCKKTHKSLYAASSRKPASRNDGSLKKSTCVFFQDTLFGHSGPPEYAKVHPTKSALRLVKGSEGSVTGMVFGGRSEEPRVKGVKGVKSYFNICMVWVRAPMQKTAAAAAAAAAVPHRYHRWLNGMCAKLAGLNLICLPSWTTGHLAGSVHTTGSSHILSRRLLCSVPILTQPSL